MLDIGWSELLVIGVVALLVVGPKELPGLLRTVGRYVGMVRRQANEFRAQFNEAIKDTEFDEIRKEVDAIRTGADTSLRDIQNAGRIDADKALDRPYGDKNHTPNFQESDLEWLGGSSSTSTVTPAERAAAAAKRSLPAPTSTATDAGTAAPVAPANAAAAASAAAAARAVTAPPPAAPQAAPVSDRQDAKAEA